MTINKAGKLKWRKLFLNVDLLKSIKVTILGKKIRTWLDIFVHLLWLKIVSIWKYIWSREGETLIS